MKAAETVSAVSVRSIIDPVVSIPRPPQADEQADGSLRVDMAPDAVDAEAGSVPAVGPEGSSGDARAFLAAPFADAAVSEPEPLSAVEAPALTPEDPQASPASQEEEEPRATPAVAIDLPLQPALVFPGEDGVTKGAEAAGTTDLVAESPEVRATTNEDAVAIHTEDQDSAASPAASALPVAVVIPAIERPVTGVQSERAIQIQPSAVSHERSATDPASVPRDAPDALAPASPTWRCRRAQGPAPLPMGLLSISTSTPFWSVRRLRPLRQWPVRRQVTGPRRPSLCGRGGSAMTSVLRSQGRWTVSIAARARSC
ncbi:hypothetical protein [Novosphingobium panipatense]|uniref:hypothetical protein n=1 Tax=Novosphingobium panipatense TaxID=428991 RepID=UPI0036236159